MGTNHELAALILAAGEGKRMDSPLAKVLHTLGGRSMIRYVVEAVRGVSPRRIVVVVGHQAEAVERELAGEGLEFVVQSERLGTAHAAMMAEPLLGDFPGTLLVLNGDTPLLTAETIRGLLAYHRGEGAAATVLSAELDDPSGYGRIIRDREGKLLRIVEHRDASEGERRVREVNSGIFCFECPDLFPALARVDRRNVQGEFYITDIMAILRNEGKRTAVYRCADRERVIGINDLEQLREAERLLKDHG